MCIREGCKALDVYSQLRYTFSMIDAALISKVKSLSPEDRLELIGVVWESLDQSKVSVSPSERDLLDTRLKDVEENPSAQSSWPEVRARLRKLVS